MKKECVLFLLLAFFVFSYLEIGETYALEISKEQPINNVVASELDKPATFMLQIKNDNTSPDYIEFVTYVDIVLAPNGTIKLEPFTTQNITLEVYPSKRLKNIAKGNYLFEYYIKSKLSGMNERRLTIKILPLSEIIKLEPNQPINFDSKSANISLKNKENIMLNNIKATFQSIFFSQTEQLSLQPYEEKSFNIALKKEELQKATAGSYIISADLVVDGAAVTIENSVTLEEKKAIETTEEEKGFLFYPVVAITKKNTGNVPFDAEIVVSRNVFAKIFTAFSKAADSVERHGSTYVYTWRATLKPGEVLRLEVKTNYLLPVGILIAIIIIALVLAVTLKAELVLRKKVTPVRTKGGEFALKITLIARAKKDLSNMVITDRYPYPMQLYEQYSVIKPDNIDKSRRLVEWHIDDMRPGEERVFSYLIFSKIHILGSINIPAALANYKYKNKLKETTSNTIYFLVEEK